MVGDGDLKHAYMELTQDLENVRFTPKVPPSQVQAVLNEADVVYFSTFPSAVWNYGQSLNKIVDYMLAGKPIIGSYGGFYSMINEAKCGYLVEANNSEALADIFFKFSRCLPKTAWKWECADKNGSRKIVVTNDLLKSLLTYLIRQFK